MYKKPAKPTEFIVKEEVGLMAFLMQQMEGISRTKVKSFLSNRWIQVDGRVVTRYDHPLHAGISVQIKRGPVPGSKAGRFSSPKEVDIVFEDDSLLVVNKRPGLLSMGKPGLNNLQTLLNQYLEHSRQGCHAHVVHRLDRETSGLMLYAKEVSLQQQLVHGWKMYVTDRRYVAIAEGWVEKDEGTVSSYLTEDSMYHVHSSLVDNGGKRAETRYRVLRRGRDYTLLELFLETGRKNQIRVHLQDIGHSVAGDRKYGSTTDPLGRLALHAYKLSFSHPVTGEKLNFETPLPTPFLKCL